MYILLKILSDIQISTYFCSNETKEEILESLKRSEEDFKNGRTHDYKEVMEASRLRLEKYRN